MVSLEMKNPFCPFWIEKIRPEGHRDLRETSICTVSRSANSDAPKTAPENTRWRDARRSAASITSGDPGHWNRTIRPDFRTDFARLDSSAWGRSSGALRLFDDAGDPFASLEFRHDVREGDVARGKHHKQVVKNVRRLGRQAFPVAAHSGDDRLHRFLAEFFRAFLRASLEQFRRPGIGGVRSLAGLDCRGETIERVHDSRTGMPAAAMRSLASRMEKSPK